MEIKTNPRLRAAAIRALCAVVAAVALLAATNFAFIKLLKSPVLIESFSNAAEGDYVSADISLVLDYYAESYRSENGSATGLYAITEDGNTFYTVMLPKRYFDSASQISGDTRDYMAGEREKLDRYFLVTGTVYKLSDQELTYFYNWFTDNSAWLQAAGVIDEVADYADYISPYALRVDYIGKTPALAVYIMSSIAWLCLVYALIIFIRWAMGKYSPKPEPAAADIGATEAEPGLTEASGENEAPDETALNGPDGGDADAEPDGETGDEPAAPDDEIPDAAPEEDEADEPDEAGDEIENEDEE